MLAAAVAAFVAATLYPYRLSPPRWVDNAVVLADGRATFPGEGILVTETVPDWLAGIRESQRLRIDLAFIARSGQQTGPARILTISDGHHARNLTIGQQNAMLVVRLRHENSSVNGKPQIVLAGAIEAGTVHRVALTVGEGVLRIEIDERRVERPLAGESPLVSWDPGFALALGNEMTWERPWRGKLFEARLATDGADVDLLADGVLQRPRGKWVNLRIEMVGHRADLVANFLLFVPIGWVTALALGRRYRAAIGLWLAVCTAVEVSQLFVEGRYFSPSDIVLNVSGVMVGMLLAHRVWRRRPA